jgi:hypothetical protein
LCCDKDVKEYWLYCRGTNEALLDRAIFATETTRTAAKQHFKEFADRGDKLSIYCFKKVTKDEAELFIEVL